MLSATGRGCLSSRVGFSLLNSCKSNRSPDCVWKLPSGVFGAVPDLTARPLQTEPRLSAQLKAVSAEHLGPMLDVGSKNITKSLASLTEIQENGLAFLPRDSYYRDRVSRTVSLPVRGHTL